MPVTREVALDLKGALPYLSAFVQIAIPVLTHGRIDTSNL
jgi:hypothetical protein